MHGFEMSSLQRGLDYFIILLCALNISLCMEDGDWTISIEHSWNQQRRFSVRGDIILRRAPYPDTSLHARYWPTSKLVSEDLRSLADAVRLNTPYLIRCSTELTDDGAKKSTDEADFVMSFTDPCRLLHSGFNDVLTLSIDSAKRRIVSITTQPSIPTGMSTTHTHESLDCSESGLDTILEEAQWNTSVRVIDMIDGPSPDVQAHIQRLEQEKMEREKGGQQDNRSFFAKYWMYIVPVVLFLMINNAVQQQGDGGEGGGGR